MLQNRPVGLLWRWRHGHCLHMSQQRGGSVTRAGRESLISAPQARRPTAEPEAQIPSCRDQHFSANPDAGQQRVHCWLDLDSDSLARQAAPVRVQVGGGWGGAGGADSDAAEESGKRPVGGLVCCPAGGMVTVADRLAQCPAHSPPARA
jgi:hypothetical protein